MKLNRIVVAFAAMLVVSGSAMAATVQAEVFAPAASSVNVATQTGRTMVGKGGVFSQRFEKVGSDMAMSASSFGSNAALGSAAINDAANRIWATPFYSTTDGKTRGGQVGSGYDYDLWGVALGYDRVFGNNFMAGVALTYSRGDYDAKGVHDDTKVDNYGASVYAGYYSSCTGFFGNVYGGYNYGDNDIRIVDGGAWHRASPHTSSYWMGAELGYNFPITEAFKLTPTVGLQYIDARTSRFGINNTRYGKFTDKSLLLPIDLAATYTAKLDDCSSLQFKVNGGYAYDFKNDGAKGNIVSAATAQTFIRGTKPGRHNWNVGAGIKYARNQFDVGVDYRFDGRKREDTHTVSATVGLNF